MTRPIQKKENKGFKGVFVVFMILIVVLIAFKTLNSGQNMFAAETSAQEKALKDAGIKRDASGHLVF